METLGLSSLCLSVLLEQDGSQSSFTSHLQSGHLPPSFLFLRMTSAHALFGLRPALREGAARAATAGRPCEASPRYGREPKFRACSSVG